MKRSHALLASCVLLVGCGAAPEEEEKNPVVTVKVATVGVVDVSRLVRAPALVHPRQQAGVASRLTAVIRELGARTGDRVAEGAVLATLEARDLEAQRADAAAALRQAEATAERREKLFAEGAIPQRDLLASRTEAEQMKARLELAETQLKFSRVESPFPGTITEQFLYPGDMARPDSRIFTVMDLSVVIARGQVPESDAGGVRQGQPCRFVPTDHPEEAVRGRVSVVTRAVDPGRRTVETWCEIENGSGRLLPGAFGELRIVTGVEPRSIVVPIAAVEFVEGTRKGTVVVVDAQKVAHRKDVVTGEVEGGRVQVKEGLAAGDLVVTEGAYGLPDGTKVTTSESKEDEPKGEK